MNPLEFLLGKSKPSSGARPGWPPAPQGKFPSAWGAPKPSAPAPTASVGRGFVLNPITAAYSIPGFGEQKAQNRLDVIEQSAGPLNELRYMGGQLMQGRVPYGKPAVGSIPPSANGESYRRAELRLADAARPGGGGGGGGNAGYSGAISATPGAIPAAERAYQSEVSRVAQLTAQDPELQRYEKARESAKTQADMDAARDIGMQIWQEKYGGTKMGQPGGAVGARNPLMDSRFGYQTGMSPQQLQSMQATAAPVPVAPGEVPYQQGDLGTRATLETGYDPAQYGLSPNLVEDMKKRLLQQASK